MKICSIKKCKKPHRAKGLCDKHYKKQQHIDNRERDNKRQTEWRLKNPAYNRNYHAEHREDQNKKHRQWCLDNREDQNKKAVARANARRQIDIQFRLKVNLRNRLRQAIKHRYKSGSAVRDCGCSIAEFIVYIESQFEPWMTWDNWGRSPSKKHPRVWHLDHKKPLTSFDLTDREQLLEACHYTNLQPLENTKNIRKRNR